MAGTPESPGVTVTAPDAPAARHLSAADFAPAVRPHVRSVDPDAYDRIFLVGDVHGCRRELETLLATLDVTDDSDLYQAIKAQKDKLQETDSLDAGDLVEDETDTDSEDAGPDLHKIADEVADNVDAYTSVHGGNGTTYLDSDMIELEHDLSIRKAEKVKKLVERKGVEI